MKYNKHQLKIGQKIEMEHTNDPKIALKIAKDHLREIPDYYTRLLKLEQEAGIQNNPSIWVVDEEIWKKAKKVVKENYKGSLEDLYPIITKVYKNMGGRINNEKYERAQIEYTLKKYIELIPKEQILSSKDFANIIKNCSQRKITIADEEIIKILKSTKYFILKDKHNNVFYSPCE